MTRYKQLRETLASEIAAGTHPVGGKFPTEYELCRRFKVSRHTVREALRQLEDRGLLSRQAGAGTKVLAPAPASFRVHAGHASGELLAIPDNTRFEQRHEGTVVLRQKLADLVGRQAGERWLHFAGIRWRSDEPVALCWTEIFVAEPYFAVRALSQGDPGAIHRTIQHGFGIDVSEVEQRVTAVPMPPDIAAELGSEPNAPALLTRRRFFANSADPFEILITLHPGEKHDHMQRFVQDPSVRRSR